MKPERPNQTHLDFIADSRGDRLVSLAMPTHVRGRQVSQDRIRLKNRLASVDSQLEAMGVRTEHRRDQLSEAHVLLDDVEFWEHQSRQLAMYVDDDGGIIPLAVSEETWSATPMVAGVFCLRFLLPEFHPGRASVLVLTRNRVALYDLTADQAIEKDSDLPESFEDVNWFVDRETQRQQHPDRPGSHRNTHGHDPTAQREEDTARFLRAVRDSLEAGGDDDPLIVLGDDGLVQQFARLSDREIHSPEHSGISDISEATVHEMASPTLEEVRSGVLGKRCSEALDRIGEGSGTAELSRALEAAVTGRVSTLLLNRKAEPVWGSFDPASMAVDIHDLYSPGDVDLIDRLVVEARRTAAEVVSIPGEVEGHDLIATYRY